MGISLELDIDSAIAAHQAWFASLRAAIDGIHAKQILEMSVADHSKCVLGAWLHSTAPVAFEDQELFRSIQEVHIEFHQIAGAIIALLEQGNADNALHILEKKLPLVSDALTLLLEELRRKQGAAGKP